MCLSVQRFCCCFPLTQTIHHVCCLFVCGLFDWYRYKSRGLNNKPNREHHSIYSTSVTTVFILYEGKALCLLTSICVFAMEHMYCTYVTLQNGVCSSSAGCETPEQTVGDEKRLIMKSYTLVLFKSLYFRPHRRLKT